MQQDELAQLFSANLTLSQNPPPQAEQQAFVEQPQQHQEQTSAPAPITYVSQHYTHSHHVAPARPVATAPERTLIGAADLYGILLRHDIDPSLLFLDLPLSSFHPLSLLRSRE